MRLFVRTAVLAGAMVAGSLAWAQSGGLDLAGTWLTEDGRAKIKVEHCGEGNDKLCGFVAWMKDPLNEKGQPRSDIKNPDPAKRARPSLGLEIMTNLKADDSTHYAGEIYNADDGKMYSVTLGIEKPAELEVRGCLLHFLCGSQTWARVADVAITPPGKLSQTASTKAVKPVAGPAHAHDAPPAQ